MPIACNNTALCSSNVIESSLILLHFSNLGNEDEAEGYEIQFSVKDYCFARSDRLLGTTILQLSQVVPLASCACCCPLGRSLTLDNIGATIVRILAQRSTEEVAQEFVHLKMTERDVVAD